MQDKIKLNQLRSFGEVIDDSIQFFKQNWRALLKSYFYICGFFWVTSLIISFVNEIQTLRRVELGGSIFSVTYFSSLAFEMLSHLIITLTVLSFVSLYKEKNNEAPSVEEVWGYVKYYFFRVFGSYLVLLLCTIIGTVFCILPGIYLAIVFSLIIPIIIIENATLSYAFNRSFQLIKNNWWFMLGVVFVSLLVIVAVLMAIIIPVMLIVYVTTFLTNVGSSHVYLYATIIITHLLQFVYMLPLIVIALAYFSFVEQKDDGTLLQRIMNLGKTDNSLTQEPTEEY
jgi:hypothetical protein